MARIFYPGCSLEQSAKPYEVSTLAVARALDLELPELADWNCCGATAYMGTHELWALALAARNLALTEAQGADELITVCNGCYVVLNKASKYIAADPELAAEVNDALDAGGLSYQGNVRVRHLLDVLVNDLDPALLNARMKTSLAGLKVAPYYGCQIGRPFDDCDDAEYPTTLDDLLEAVEAAVVPYPLKSRCCGGMLMSTSTDVAGKLVVIDKDRTGPTESLPATVLCPCQAEIRADDPQQHTLWRCCQTDIFPIELKIDCFFHPTSSFKRLRNWGLSPIKG